ncbi:MarR family winged helix-turn-helix transcriptional regulator [Saccharothrix sp. NRRL B-16314]|uniref:MarR family winged helix-turn-helix transcriptional regulator n=1 Tax=Saccharothrix sp. NRRL B-16314 TaxID=1463825 RepID=UPI000526C29C|nr:MarR family transcriptional regulator [Saccharothrix sp. NRRL B-16314]
MSPVNKPAVELANDPDGTLFDSRVRTAMTAFTDDGDTLAFEAAAAVRTAFHAVERLRSRGTDSRGLSSGALDVLIRLSTAPEDGMSLGALAGSAGVSARNATGLVDTLERDGLVERVPDRNDRRSVLARITPRGEEWLDAFRRPSQLAMAAIFRGFTPAELTQLRHLCLRLADNQTRIEQHLNATDQGETP